ncbi:MAG: group I intron-associated PD-(D/E)XK endonuclease [Candidatus Levyibacteriota bacterium]
MNSKRKGSIAVGEAIAYFISKGKTVLISISDCDKYDLVIDNGGSFKKIQCKYSGSQEPSGAYVVDLSTYGGYRTKTYHVKYIKGDFDFLFVYCSNGERYLIPAKEVIGKLKISVGKKSWRQYIVKAGVAE